MHAMLRALAFTAAVFIVVYGMIITETHSDIPWLLLLFLAAGLLLIAFVPRLPSSLQQTNRGIVVCGAVFVVGFLIMTAQLVRIQIVESAEISDRTGRVGDGGIVANPRKQIKDAQIARGRIYSRDGAVIADTVRRGDGTFGRTFPNPHLAYVAGYHSPILFGSSNLESRYNSVLVGDEGGNPFNEWLDGVLHRTTHGYDLVLSIDSEIQLLADNLLGDRRGAVVLMDARTGAVHAIVSKPNFDPNPLYVGFGAGRSEEVAKASQYWSELNQQEGSPLILRPTQGVYAPGSIFKTITAAAVLESGLAEPDTVYRNEGALTVNGRVIIEQNLPDQNRVSYTLTESYGYSLNVVFAQIGLQVGPELLEEYARRFGFGETIPFDLSVTPSQVANDTAYLHDNVGLADTAFGQGQLFVTPLQMAMMVQAVVNDGQMMEPYLVAEYRDVDGEHLQTRRPSNWRRALEPATARQLVDIMIASVQDGYAVEAQIPGAVVGGKTGTAEVGDQTPHAWFVGFAGTDEARYVVAVVVEHGGSGTSVALPIGRELLRSALERLD
jgi:penicillin-binding protein A